MSYQPEIITYDGVPIATAIPGINIIDYKIGAMQVEITMEARKYAAGSDYIKRRHDSREIEITVELPFDKENLLPNFGRLRTWAEKAVPKPLILGSCPDRRILAVAGAFGDLSPKEWYNPITFKMTAPDGYFEQIEASSANVGEAFDVEGNGPIWPTITHQVTGALENPEWVIDSGKKIIVMGSYESGTIVINTARRMATHNGSYCQLSLITRFQQIEPGAHIITGPTGGVIEWNERWL